MYYKFFFYSVNKMYTVDMYTSKQLLKRRIYKFFRGTKIISFVRFNSRDFWYKPCEQLHCSNSRKIWSLRFQVQANHQWKLRFRVKNYNTVEEEKKRETYSRAHGHRDTRLSCDGLPRFIEKLRAPLFFPYHQPLARTGGLLIDSSYDQN